MPTCIYCKELKSPGEFTKEHVLTRAFCGAGENWTLVNMVCGDCNGRFSAMESHWCHGAVEAVMRNFSGPPGRSAGRGRRPRQPIGCDHVYMVQGGDDVVYEAGFGYPTEFYVRPQIVRRAHGAFSLVPGREDVPRLKNAVDGMVEKGTFEVSRQAGSTPRAYEVAKLVLDFDANECRMVSKRTADEAAGYWVRSFPVPPTVAGFDDGVGHLAPRCAVDDRDRLYFRSDDWAGVTALLTDLVAGRRSSGAGARAEQTFRIGVRVKKPLVFRAVMKTGLNYVAHVAGADVALDGTFDGLRRMIMEPGKDDEVVRSCRLLGVDERPRGRAGFPKPPTDGEHRLMLDEFGGSVRFRIRLYEHVGYECVLGPATPRTREVIGTRRACVEFAGRGIRGVDAWE